MLGGEDRLNLRYGFRSWPQAAALFPDNPGRLMSAFGREAELQQARVSAASMTAHGQDQPVSNQYCEGQRTPGKTYRSWMCYI